MTVYEAKEFLINLQSVFVNDKDLSSEENEKIMLDFFEVAEFCLKNLAFDVDNNKNKCDINCPFFTSDKKEVCKKLNPEQNCYQCIIREYQRMKSQNRLFQEMKDKTIEQEQEILELKARLYDLEGMK